MFVLFGLAHRKQDDITQFSHHLWTQPSTQAEELGQRVFGAEFRPCRGKCSHHQRCSKDDRHLRYAIYGKLLNWTFFTFDSRVEPPHETVTVTLISFLCCINWTYLLMLAGHEVMVPLESQLINAIPAVIDASTEGGVSCRSLCLRLSIYACRTAGRFQNKATPPPNIKCCV